MGEVKNSILWVILILGIIGALFAAYQTYEHYYLTTTICDFTENFSCSAVTESQYGEFPPGSGVSLALWGIIWWIGLLWITRQAMHVSREAKEHFVLFLYSLAGLGFVGYLLLIELYLLPKITGIIIICPFCTVQHILIAIIAVASFFLLQGSFRDYIGRLFFRGKGRKRRLDPKPFFVLGALVLLVAGQFLILGTGEPLREYPEFTECLAEQGATMYGFDACPSCNRQKTLLGIESFTEYIDDTGLYVRCRPKSEAIKHIGDLVDKISSVEPLERTTTNNEACAINVGEGTPTWVIHGQKYVGAQTVEDLAAASGCPLPDIYEEQEGAGTP